MSIFSEQLQFKPLTPERRRLLRMEVNLLGLLLLTVAFLTIFEFCKVEVGAFLRSMLSPILQPILAPLGDFIQAYILVPLRDFIALVHIDRIWLQCFAQFMTFVGKFIGHCVEVLAPFLPPALLIARHIGLVGWKNFGREESVLTHEIKRRLLAWFEPRIEIRMDRRTLLSELSGLMVLIVVTYAACFLILSGLATNFLPGEFWPMLDHGIGNWTIACLHDAKLSVPHAWIEYLSLYQSSLTVDPAKALFDWRTYFYVSHMFRAHIPVPSDFAAYRLFVGFIGSLLMAIPTTLLLVCIGIDDLLVKRLIITPTRLLHGWRFLYLFSLTRTYLWRNVIAVSIAEDKTEDIIIEFPGRKVRIGHDQISAENKTLLLQAVEELAPACQVNPELRSQLKDARHCARQSYTLFWEDALGSKRKSTVFTPLSEGQKLAQERLEIVRQLAGQGWSATYLGRFKNELVVVRESFLSQDSEEHIRAAQALERESRILAGLSHERIASVVDHFVENGRSYLILQYIAGRDLRQQAELNGPIHQMIVIEYALQVCSILEYLHSQSPPIIHRDISPDNLVIADGGNIHLIDFGASKQFVQNATGTMIGKQAFMAPEQLRGKAGVRSDLYSLGATMYFLLTARDPLALMACRPALINEVDAELDDLIFSMTSFDECDRPSSVSDVKQKLQDLHARLSKPELEWLNEPVSSLMIKLSLKVGDLHARRIS